jgi:hypothetical protein
MQREPDYYTPLHVAIVAWKPEVAKFLITKVKADVHAVAQVCAVILCSFAPLLFPPLLLCSIAPLF